jgi:hypothetical protein
MIFFLIIPFFMLGCAVFLICAAIPFLRRYALSASLWCLCLAPWLFGMIFLALLFGLATYTLSNLLRHPLWIAQDWSGSNQTAFGIVISVAAVAGSLVTATVAARVHQFAIHRMTLALFRLYVAGVSLGVGVLSSIFLSVSVSGYFHLSLAHPIVVFGFCGIVFSMLLSLLCYRFASQFRGKLPSSFSLVTEDEFYSASAIK